jgi:putative CocE/NonD family hydrolase
MKKVLMIICLAVVAKAVCAQQLYFSAKNYVDSVTLQKKLPELARQVINRYKEPDKFSYFDNLFRLQLVSGDYIQAQTSLWSYIRLAGATIEDTVSTRSISFGYQVYLADKIRNTSKSIDTYAETFDILYRALSSAAQDEIPNYFIYDVPVIKPELEGLTDKASKADSISVKDALAICRSYSALLVRGQTEHKLQQLFAKKEKSKYIHEDSVLLKMPDGGIISLTLYRDKKIIVPQPVVLIYNIYVGTEASDCMLAVRKGYVGIVANTRGKRLSPNNLEPFMHDAKDAYAIIDWISKQPWCNGKVGMYGGSYTGFSQWAASKYLHPALKTIVPQAAAAPNVDFPGINGIFQTYLLRYLHFVMDSKQTDYAGFFDEKKWFSLAGKWYQKGSSFRSLDTLEGRPNAIFQRYLKHPSYDSFWQNTIPQKEEFGKINIPVLTITGYYDDDQIGAMHYYHQHHKWNKNPNHYLLIGPFDHGGAQYKATAILGGYAIDSVAKISIIDIVFQWFDHVLKGDSLPPMLKDRVNFEVMGTNQWQHVSSLAKMHNDSLKFYLTNIKHNEFYPMVLSKPSKANFINQKIDLTERSDMRFRGADVMAFTKLIDSNLNPEKEKLMFVSEPVDGTFSISGSITAIINLKINKKDIDLVLDLYEQTPNGQFFALNESVQRASYSRDRTKRQLLQPGKMETVHMTNNFITSKKLQKGSRIIILLGVNKSPNWQLNYGTGKDVSDETIADGKVPLMVKWFNSSYVSIPILR